MPNKRISEIMVGAANAILISALAVPALAQSTAATGDAANPVQSASETQSAQMGMAGGPGPGGYGMGAGWPGGSYGMGGPGQGMGPGGYGMGPGYGMDVPPPPAGYGGGDVPPPPPGYQGGVEPPAPGYSYPGFGYGPGAAAAQAAPPQAQALSGQSAAQPAAGMGGRRLGMGRPGMMRGGMGRPGMPQLLALELSDEQQKQLEDIAADVRKTHWDLMGQRMDEAMKLPRLYAAERPDAKAIGKVYEKMFNLKRQMIEATIEGRNRAHDVLTEEQRAQLQRPPRMPGPPGWR